LSIVTIHKIQTAPLPTRTPYVDRKSVAGETLTAPKVDSVNTFDAPNTVVPKPVSAKVQGGKLSLKLEQKSITVLAVNQ